MIDYFKQLQDRIETDDHCIKKVQELREKIVHELNLFITDMPEHTDFKWVPIYPFLFAKMFIDLAALSTARFSVSSCITEAALKQEGGVSAEMVTTVSNGCIENMINQFRDLVEDNVNIEIKAAKEYGEEDE